MKTIIKWLPILAIYYTSMGCFNEVKVPSEIAVKPVDVHVVHEVSLSTQITDFLSQDCDQSAADNALKLGDAGYQEYMDSCVAARTSDLINELTDSHNAAQAGVPAEGSAPNMVIQQ